MCELVSVKNSNQNIIKKNTLYKKIYRKKKRELKNTNKITINFSNISKPIPESQETKKIRKEIREEYYIKVEKIRQTYKDISEKEKILEIITELEELFYTALLKILILLLLKIWRILFVWNMNLIPKRYFRFIYIKINKY